MAILYENPVEYYILGRESFTIFFFLKKQKKCSEERMEKQTEHTIREKKCQPSQPSASIREHFAAVQLEGV